MNAAPKSARTRKAQLPVRAREALASVAAGLVAAPENGLDGAPSRLTLDRIEDAARVLVLGVLVVRMAEARKLVRGDRGFGAILERLSAMAPSARATSVAAYGELISVFSSVHALGAGLFDASTHADLAGWTLRDDTTFALLSAMELRGEHDARSVGDVYESLLGVRLVADASHESLRCVARDDDGERKASGSYFTRHALVDALVARVVDPLLVEAGDDPDRILALRVVDPAMGTGHFLIALVDRIAERLPRSVDERARRRLAAEHCAFGVDRDPIAIELAKVVLWLHTADPSTSFAFLDRNLRCGDALVGSAWRARSDSSSPSGLPRFDWAAQFPGVAPTGFDAVLGNPPWEKLKPATRDFYAPFSPDVSKRQGPSLDRLVRTIDEENPGLGDAWSAHVARIDALSTYLRTSGEYVHQVAHVHGRKTGGDADLFRYFVERASQLVRPGGRWGLIVPTTLFQAEGCTGLRRMLLGEHRLESAHSFENHRRWAFAIHASFKFTAFVAIHAPTAADTSFEATFMQRDMRAMNGLAPDRVVRLTRADVEATCPGSLALLDLRSAEEAALVARLHLEHPGLGTPQSGWGVTYARELDVTNDAWLFKSSDFMRARGFRMATEGGEAWVAADESYYRAHGFLERRGSGREAERRWFVHPDDVGDTERGHRVFPLERYTAVYEGRLLHAYDAAYQRYVRAEGPTQLWACLGMDEKTLAPRVFASQLEAGLLGRGVRVGFRDIARGTDERTLIAAHIGGTESCGNKVPVLRAGAEQTRLLPAVLNSFVADFLLRLRVGATLNWIHVSQLAVPTFAKVWGHADRERVVDSIARLACLIPELAELWTHGQWTVTSAARDPHERARLRADLDAIVAELYGLTVPEYAYVLTTFPALDRNQPSLRGDFFGLVPRSFVTRDLALLAYARRMRFPIPRDLEAFYRDEVGIDANAPSSTFRVGAYKDLEERVAEAQRIGAVAYVPSGRANAQRP